MTYILSSEIRYFLQLPEYLPLYFYYITYPYLHPILKHQDEKGDPVRSCKLDSAETFAGARRHGLNLATLVDKDGKHKERDYQETDDENSDEPSGKRSEKPSRSAKLLRHAFNRLLVSQFAQIDAHPIRWTEHVRPLFARYSRRSSCSCSSQP